uniref:Uncharacterized protein n=1 Tax=Tetraselmis sp. GSL018 TaxID=582737 RepID=A0A061RHF8_9CHLO
MKLVATVYSMNSELSESRETYGTAVLGNLAGVEGALRKHLGHLILRSLRRIGTPSCVGRPYCRVTLSSQFQAASTSRDLMLLTKK